MVLSGAQAKLIQANWKAVRGDAQAAGNALFLKYLTQNPGDEDHFAKFHDVPLDQLEGNAAFNAQTKIVIDAIGQIVDSLDTVQKAAQFLRERVRTHYPRGIHIAQFERLLDLMPTFLEENAKADGNTADAWRILISDLMPAMRDEYARCHE
eukprot:Polyplicarium_translucidae@DN2819_c0_g1_i1.p2